MRSGFWNGPNVWFTGPARPRRDDEVPANYGGSQLKKAHDMATALIRQRYGKAAEQTYFVGGSEGGNEALAVAQSMTPSSGYRLRPAE